jgi:hypothetical protein
MSDLFRKIREAWWEFTWGWAAEGNRDSTTSPVRRKPLLGEDEDGTILMPSRTRAEWWEGRFNPRNPTHWPAYLRSRRARSLAMVEAAR